MDINRKYADNLIKGKEFVSASAFGIEGHSPAVEGSRMLVFPDGATSGTVGGGALEKDIIIKAAELFGTRKSRVLTYDLDSGNEKDVDEKTGMPCGGKVSIFLEYFGSPDSLIIFGCGHVGEALVKISADLGFSVSCIDEREEYSERITRNYNVSVLTEFPEKYRLSNAFIVIATYSHEKDYEILGKIIKSGIKYNYLGIVASSRKWKMMKEKLILDSNPGIDFSLIYSPAGLGTGGGTPADIALSIAAEINSVRNDISELSHLRDKKKSE